MTRNSNRTRPPWLVRLGSLAAALTAYAVLFDADVRTPPLSFASDVPAGQLVTLLEAVQQALTDGPF